MSILLSTFHWGSSVIYNSTFNFFSFPRVIVDDVDFSKGIMGWNGQQKPQNDQTF